MHGTVPPVKFICEEPRIKAISFVGGDKAGQYIYETGNKHGKRVQANLGAKSTFPFHVFGKRDSSCTAEIGDYC